MNALTRKRQDGPAGSVPLIGALEELWGEIRRRHPDVPPVFVVTGQGSDHRRQDGLRLGHFAADRRRGAGAGESGLAEMFVGGEGLAEGAEEVMDTLLHEAAHGVAEVRGIQDTSRQGRYHNRRYRSLAEELGVQVDQEDGLGWASTSVPPATAEAYATAIDRLDRAITVYRRSEAPVGEGAQRPASRNGVACVCGCRPPRGIRVARGVLERGGISCDVCGRAFAPAGSQA